jgi:hypothetical protein
MLVPENQQQSTTPKYAVSLYLATSGIGGHLMGSDEKEIIYLVFGIVDIQNKEVSEPKVICVVIFFHLHNPQFIVMCGIH